MPTTEVPSATDHRAVVAQIGRVPRARYRIAARGGCGLPAVIETPPVLPDGAPFPTLWYLTCRRLNAAVSTLEADGWMVRAAVRLADDPEFAESFSAAHDHYLRRREALGSVPELAGVSAGGMPVRVKCLHALVAHSLAAGPGVNPVGDDALTELESRGAWPCLTPCVEEAPDGV